jgi:hypothetical protein
MTDKIDQKLEQSEGIYQNLGSQQDSTEPFINSVRVCHTINCPTFRRSTYLSRSITISQCGVCGKRSTATDFTGRKGSEMGIDLTLCRAKPALLIFLHALFLFPFSTFSGEGVQSSIALATKVSGLQEM